MKNKTLAPRLATAVLAAGLLVTTAAPSMAATNPAAFSQATSSANYAKDKAAETAKLGTALANATTVGGALSALKAAGGLDTTDAVKTLSLLPKGAAVNADPGDDSLAPSSSELIRAAVARLNGADDGSCPASDASTWLLDQILPKKPAADAPQSEVDEYNHQFGNVFALMLLTGNTAAYQAVWNGPDIKALKRFGEEQDKTKVVNTAFKNVKAFWDVNFGKITSSAMKDDILTKRGGKSALELGLYTVAAFSDGAENEVDPRDPSKLNPDGLKIAKELGAQIQTIIDDTPTVDGGESPFFTFNAFAFYPGPFQESKGLPKRFVFGDGLLTYLRVSKAGDTGVSSIVGHEMGHHIQYIDGFNTSASTSWENGRADELEADYFGNYYAGHKLGANFNAAQRAIAEKLFSGLGDCSVGEDGHHGTPAQRGAAVTAAFALADTQKKNKHVFAAESVRLKFNKDLPAILAAK